MPLTASITNKDYYHYYYERLVHSTAAGYLSKSKVNPEFFTQVIAKSITKKKVTQVNKGKK